MKVTVLLLVAVVIFSAYAESRSTMDGENPLDEDVVSSDQEEEPTDSNEFTFGITPFLTPNMQNLGYRFLYV